MNIFFIVDGLVAYILLISGYSFSSDGKVGFKMLIEIKTYITKNDNEQFAEQSYFMKGKVYLMNGIICTPAINERKNRKCNYSFK